MTKNKTKKLLFIYLEHGPRADDVSEEVDGVENDAHAHGDGQQGRVPPSGNNTSLANYTISFHSSINKIDYCLGRKTQGVVVGSNWLMSNTVLWGN